MALSQIRRELFLKIFNGHTPTNLDYDPIGSPLHFITEHLPERYVEPALRWLVTHNCVGKEFIKLHRETCKGSDIAFQKLLISIVDNDKIKPLIAGEGYRQ